VTQHTSARSISRTVASTVPRSRSRASIGRLLATGLGAVAILLVAAQVVLPRVAADRLRGELAPHGHVASVTVSAFPALELLWGQADDVRVRMSDYRARPVEHRPRRMPTTGRAQTTSPIGAVARPIAGVLGTEERLARLLDATADAGSVTASFASFQAGPVQLSDVVFTKRGPRLAASGVMASEELTSALPKWLRVEPARSTSRALALQATVRLFGLSASLVARLVARNGAIAIEPDLPGGIPIPSTLGLTVFRDPDVRIDSVGSKPVTGGWKLIASGELRS
jgi:hypothetical protein